MDIKYIRKGNTSRGDRIKSRTARCIVTEEAVHWRDSAVGTTIAQQPEGSLEHVDNEAFIIVKAAPRASKINGETDYIAMIDQNGCCG
jgi:hypothetical protein